MPTILAEIPIIDFAPFLQKDPGKKHQVVEQIDRTCREIGFFYLVNHSISQDLLDRLLEQSRYFFDLPASIKQQMARSSETNCGYIAMQQERLDPSKPGDLKEAFNVGLQSIWPPEQEKFRQVVMEFYHLATVAVAPQILQAFALALGLEETFFADKHSRNFFLRILHYPPIKNPPLPGQARAGAHTDYGSITLLLQDATGGLEVRTRYGEWILAQPLPGALLINVGDAMQRWTNDRFCSTPHRVGLPDSKHARRSRYSVALFCDPDPEVQIDCLKTCCSPEHPPRYPSISAGDYLASRFAATY